MSGLKEYEVRTTSGYTTTFQYSDADAKLRGLLGKDVDSVAKANARQEAAKAAEKAKRAVAAAAKKAEEEAAAKTAADANPEGAKAGQPPANKQAPAPANK